MPLALVLGFKKYMGVPGFWLGFCVALVGCDIAVASVLFFSRWEPVQKATADDDDTAADFELEQKTLNNIK